MKGGTKRGFLVRTGPRVNIITVTHANSRRPRRGRVKMVLGSCGLPPENHKHEPSHEMTHGHAQNEGLSATVLTSPRDRQDVRQRKPENCPSPEGPKETRRLSSLWCPGGLLGQRKGRSAKATVTWMKYGLHLIAARQFWIVGCAERTTGAGC